MSSNPPRGISEEFLAGHVPGQYRRFPGATSEWVVVGTCGCGHQLRSTTTHGLRQEWARHLLSAMLDRS